MDVNIRPGVAAGHPATAGAGIEILAAGGNAADAAVAATLASCVGETLFTGLGGGGFATYYEAATGEVTCLDFFVSVPGLNTHATPSPMTPVHVEFGGVPIQYEIGASSVAVPGVPAGCGELHRRFGQLDWHDVVAPAIELARLGVPLPHPQAVSLISIALAMLPGDGAISYAPKGRLLTGGEILFHPGLARALTALAEEGPQVFYTGWVGEAMVAMIGAGGGIMTGTDLAEYRVLEVTPTVANFFGYTVRGRADLNRTISTLDSMTATDPVSIVQALDDRFPRRAGDTTNVSVVDARGNACVVTTTLGIGAGIWLPGLGVHLNSMLGEGELLTSGIRPGDRVASMMCPLVVTDDDGLVLAAGSAGASRIRTALVHLLVGVLIEGRSVADAIAHPRMHCAAGILQTEPGFPDSALAALTLAGYPPRIWASLDHYFGGASAVGRAGAAGDPRRGGVGLLL